MINRIALLDILYVAGLCSSSVLLWMMFIVLH